MFAEEIRRQAEVAPVAALPAVTAALWRAYGEGKISEAEAEALSSLIEARTTRAPPWVGNDRVEGIPSNHPEIPGGLSEPGKSHAARAKLSNVGSRPRTDASMERRRRWAASGRLPPGLAAQFTLAEQAVLALVAAEVARRGDCRLAIDNLAAVAGVSRTTVKNAIRQAVRLDLLTVEERQVTGWRNDTNVVRIVGREWLAWLRLARKHRPNFIGLVDVPTAPQRGGVKSATTTSTQVLILSESGTTEDKKCCRGAASDLDRADRTRIRAGRRLGGAMR